MDMSRYGASSLDALLAGRVHTVREILDQLRTDIERRQSLSDEARARIFEQYLELRQEVLIFEVWRCPLPPGLEARRASLEEKLFRLVAEERQERLSAWRDTAFLHQEFRRWFKEYRELAQKQDFFTRQ